MNQCNAEDYDCKYESKGRCLIEEIKGIGSICEYQIQEVLGYKEELCTINPNKPDKYNQHIIKLLEKQVDKGLNKYGYMLQDNPASIIERLNHLEEELADALRYIQWIKEGVSNG
jgi:hypothetical protein